MRKPDFILIGAMKCGTSTLAAQLAAQNGLFITDPKEPNYFSDDNVFARGKEWYYSLFEYADPGDLLGEASTHYTKRPDHPDTLKRMQVALPNPRLIYMIRDPMERLVSHYIHDWSEGIISCSLEEAVRTHSRLVDYGRYGWQIAPYVEAFGANSILLTSLERIKSDPSNELARVAIHLGHLGSTSWINEQSTKNVSSERVRRFPLHGLIVENRVATIVRRLLVPKTLRTKIRNARRMTHRPSLPIDLRPALEETFAEDRAVLGRHFPGDPSLDLAYPFLCR